MRSICVYRYIYRWGDPCTGLHRPWGLQEVDAPRFQDIGHTKAVRLSAPTHRPLLPPRKYSWYSFLLVVESTPRTIVRQGVGLRPLACWDRGFESHRGHGCLPVSSVMCCQVEVSATSRSLVQRSSTDWCVVVCDLETSRMRRPWPALGRSATEIKTNHSAAGRNRT